MSEMRDKYRQVFESPTGREVLADLRAEFYDRSLVGTTEQETVGRAAQHDVILYIFDMMEADNG